MAHMTSRVESPDTARFCVARRERGITLVELMVAITISLIILAVMAQIFASSRGTYVVEEGLARVQESGRFAMDTIAYDIRMAGGSGCINLADTQVNNNIAALPANYDRSGILGFRYVGSGGNSMTTDWSPSLPSEYFSANEVRPYSDVIIVKYAVSSGWPLNNTTPNNTTVQVLEADVNNGIQVGNVLMVTDCKNADIFAVQALTNSGGTTSVTTITPTTPNLKNSYSASQGGELLVFNMHAYYSGNTQRNDQNGNPIPALFRKTLGNNGVVVRDELVEGVEVLKAFYGVLPAGLPKSSSAPDRYMPATATIDWPSVASVRVGLVLSTLENVGNEAATTGIMDVVGFRGSTGDNAMDDYNPPDDKRQRRGFSFVVQKRKPLRN